MELTPILIIMLSIALGIVILLKITMGVRYRILKERKPKNIIEYFVLYFVSLMLMWFPIMDSGNNVKQNSLKSKINIVTYILYGLVVALGIVVYLQIYRIRNA